MKRDIASLLGKATEMLRQGLTHSPRLDAEVLMSHLVRQQRAWLLAHPEWKLEDSLLKQYFRWIKARSRGVPVAYLTGEKEFWSLRLRVTPRVLIPRPETELLVERGLQCLPEKAGQVLDLGTGCGPIALALASERPDVQIVAVDRSPHAIEIAQENAKQLEIDNVRFLVSDWYSEIRGGRFDLILANPPYVATDHPYLSGEVRYEPREALVSGESGLADLQTIVSGAPSSLLPNGRLMLEHGFDQAEAVQKMLQVAGFSQVETLADLAGIPRVASGTMQ